MQELVSGEWVSRCRDPKCPKLLITDRSFGCKTFHGFENIQIFPLKCAESIPNQRSTELVLGAYEFQLLDAPDDDDKNQPIEERDVFYLKCFRR